MKSIFLVWFALVLALGVGTAAARQSNIESQGRPVYFEGVMTIMLKEGIAPIPTQEGAVILGITSLDELVEKHQIQSVQKRFKHRPIPKNSGLPDLSRLYRLTFPKDIDVWKVAAAFAHDPNVEFAEPMPIAYLADVPDDELYDQLQHLRQIMAGEAWEIHHGEEGAPIVIGIVDTGVDYNHPDLTENVWQNLAEDADGDGHTLEFNGIEQAWELDPGDLNGLDDDANGYTDDLIGWDFYNELGSFDNDPADVRGHGTHCSGIAAGATNNSVGIASISWNLKFLSTKHTREDIGFVRGYDGIIYAAENGADIISNSWGTTMYSEADQLAVEYASGLGSIVVAAAHNFDNNAVLMYPAAYPGVISVAAVAANDEKASYSNYGMTIDVSAPGGDSAVDGGIISTIMGGGYEGWNGTSMATPMVAGLLGLVKSYHPEWANEQITTQVLGTADDIDGVNPGYENMLGSGRINAYLAMDRSGVSVAQQLRVELFEKQVTDAGGDGVLDPGEIVDLDFTLRNYAHFVGSSDASLTLTSDNPDVVVLAGEHSCSVPEDDYFDIDGVFQIQIAADASAHIATLTLQLDADVEVLFGSEMEFTLLVAPSGIFVYEGVADGTDYSGVYLRDLLQEMGFPVVYSNQITPGLTSFDAVFLSCGNWGQQLLYGTYPTAEGTVAMIEYLENGGKMYVEGGSFIGAYAYFSHPSTYIIKQLFGVGSFSDNLYSNPLDSLVGQPSTLAEGIEFTESTQVENWYINTFIPAPGCQAAFEESDHGNVALQNVGSFGQKTFLFSYSLSDLVDDDPPSTRRDLLNRIIAFFGLQVSVVDEPDVPVAVRLVGNHPNPFNPQTTIEFEIPSKQDVTVSVFDLRGRRMRVLASGNHNAGRHQVSWNGRDSRDFDVASGTYLVRLETQSGVQAKKVMLLR